MAFFVGENTYSYISWKEFACLFSCLTARVASYCASDAGSNRVMVSLSVKTMIYVFAKSLLSFCSVCKNVTENK